MAEELGRSDEFIKETVEYAKKLQSQQLPVIFSTFHLCKLSRMPYSAVKEILNKREVFYKFYKIKKRTGGFRQIMSPFKDLANLQRFIALILNNVNVHQTAYGFVKNRNIHQNASVHINAECILNIDLFKFFDTITEKRVYGLFKSLGYASNLCVDFAKISTVALPSEYYNAFSEDEMTLYRSVVRPNEAVLPQGAPTSPYISNLLCRKLDIRLVKLATKLGCKYSRYADDLTFSGSYKSLPYHSTLEQIINDEGFLLNNQKIRLYRKGKRQTVTGLTVSERAYVNRKFKDEVNRHVYACKKFGVAEHLQHEGIEQGFFKEWLLGKIMFINSVEPKTASKLLHIFNKEIEWDR